MAKYIDANKMADELSRVPWYEREDEKQAIRMVKEFPAADVVEVVRCKDCKHSEEFIYPEGLETMVCWEDNADRKVNRNGFCEKGERRASDE